MAALPSSFLDVCTGKTPDSIPVWFMRQAGRSLPEYAAVRGTGDILHAISQPELVTEITLQPVRRHGVDAAVLYSDIMVPLHAIGFGVEIKPGVGPVISQPFQDKSDLNRIRGLDGEADTPYVLEAIRQLRKELAVPLLGFVGAPFTLACYAVEGGPSKNFTRTKSLMHSDPELWNALMEKLTALCIDSLNSQIDAGAQAIQLFDSWAGALSPHDYAHQVAPHSRKLFSAIRQRDVPSVHFGVATGELLKEMTNVGPDVLGVDWRVPLDVARERSGASVLQGNLDPAVCLGPADSVFAQADRVIDEGQGGGHIFNLGHGVLPNTDPGILTALVDHVHSKPPGGPIDKPTRK